MVGLVGCLLGQSVAVGAPGPSLAGVDVAGLSGHPARVAVSWAVLRQPEAWTHWLCADCDVVAGCDARVPPSVVRVFASRALRHRVSRPSETDIIWETDPIDDRGILLPGMISTRWWEHGTFDGQQLKRGVRTGGRRLLCPGSSLVAGVHLACLMLGGVGSVVLYGADGQIVGGERRFSEGKTVEGRQVLSERQLVAANSCLERSREALVGHFADLRLEVGTPSAIRWPRSYWALS